MNGIFEVEPFHLDRLTPAQAVEFFRDLLWADARRIGFPLNAINISHDIFTPDGGVDASINADYEVQNWGDVLFARKIAYQIKAGANFSIANRPTLQKELFGSENRNARAAIRDNLSTRLREHFDSEGAYVLVSTNHDLPDPSASEGILRELLQEAGYATPNVRVWTQNQLISFLTRYPSIALRINGNAIANFQTHRSWGQQGEFQGRSYFPGKTQLAQIEDIRSVLRSDTDRAMHIQVVGNAGIGKSRLVFEALNQTDLSGQVVYVGGPELVDGGDLMTALRSDDNDFQVTLVVDECQDFNVKQIWNHLQFRGPRIRLITISQDTYNADVDDHFVDELPRVQLSEIISSYGVQRSDADRYADACQGYPRFAHMLGTNLRDHPEDLLRPIDANGIWDRVFSGRRDPDSLPAREVRRVLRYVALFRKFGFGQGALGEEGRRIASLIEKHFPSITSARFAEIIKELQDRRLLQGHRSLYLTPKILQVRLWVEWWECYGPSFVFDEFVSIVGIDSQLLDWFFEMFEYASESPIASEVAVRLLGEDGPFSDDAVLENPRAARFFRALADADLEAALSYLERTIALWPQDRLLKFQSTRQQFVWVLEKIAYDGRLFDRAARVLLKLAISDKSEYSNNSRGTLIGLFSLAYGNVAPTSAPPEHRFPLLCDMMYDKSPQVRLIAREACQSALRVHGTFRTVGPEFRGLRRTAEPWAPRTYGEIFDAFRRIWRLLEEATFSDLPVIERHACAKVLTDTGRGVTSINDSLVDMVVETLERVATIDFERKRNAVRELAEIVGYDRERHSAEVIERIQTSIERLEGNSFDERLRRHVGIPLMGELHGIGEGDPMRNQKELKRLAEETLLDMGNLTRNLDWLFSREAEVPYQFGNALAVADTEATLYEPLIEAQKLRPVEKGFTSLLLAGYFRHMFDTRREHWEAEAARHLKSNYWREFGYEIVWRSGLSDRILKILLDMAKQNLLEEDERWQVLATPQIGKFASPDTLHDILTYLSVRGDYAGLVAATNVIFYTFIHDNENSSIPIDYCLSLVTSPLWMDPKPSRGHNLVDYEYEKIASAVIRHDREAAMGVGEFLLKNIGNDNSIFEGHYSFVVSLFHVLAELYPEPFWELLTNHLGPPITTQAFHIYHWLKGDDFVETDRLSSGLLHFEPGLLWAWIDKDIEKRAWYAATFVPKELHHDPDRVCYARELLICYGDRDDVQRNFGANYSTESWSGSEASHYQSVKQSLESFLIDETNHNVRTWVMRYIEDLSKRIENARVQEEREF